MIKLLDAPMPPVTSKKRPAVVWILMPAPPSMVMLLVIFSNDEPALVSLMVVSEIGPVTPGELNDIAAAVEVVASR